MSYVLKDMRLSVDAERSDVLQIHLNAIYTELVDDNKDAYNKNEPDYTPFGRALFSLLVELTNPYHTSEDYLKEKIEVLFDA